MSLIVNTVAVQIQRFDRIAISVRSALYYLTTPGLQSAGRPTERCLNVSTKLKRKFTLNFISNLCLDHVRCVNGIMNLAVSVQSHWDYLRVCFSDWPFWAIIYFLLNCAFKLKHSFKKTPSIPWDSEEFSQVIWPKQSFNFTFNFTENSLESEHYSNLDRIPVHFGHTSKAPKRN